jgi:hypothetical protein
LDRTHDYARHGTTTLIAALDTYAAHKRVEVRDWPAVNPRIQVHFRHRHQEFLRFLKHTDH